MTDLPNFGGLGVTLIKDGRNGPAHVVWKAIGFFGSAAQVLNVDGVRAWGVEYRTVAYGGGVLLPLMNMLEDPRSVMLKLGGAACAMDLLTRQKVSPEGLRLRPMESLLLQVAGPRGSTLP